MDDAQRDRVRVRIALALKKATPTQRKAFAHKDWWVRDKAESELSVALAAALDGFELKEGDDMAFAAFKGLKEGETE